MPVLSESNELSATLLYLPLHKPTPSFALKSYTNGVLLKPIRMNLNGILTIEHQNHWLDQLGIWRIFAALCQQSVV